MNTHLSNRKLQYNDTELASVDFIGQAKAQERLDGDYLHIFVLYQKLIDRLLAWIKGSYQTNKPTFESSLQIDARK